MKRRTHNSRTRTAYEESSQDLAKSVAMVSVQHDRFVTVPRKESEEWNKPKKVVKRVLLVEVGCGQSSGFEQDTVSSACPLTSGGSNRVSRHEYALYAKLLTLQRVSMIIHCCPVIRGTVHV